MKIAVTIDGKDLESNVSSVFGRSPFFLMLEIQDKKIVKTIVLENVAAKQSGGTGIFAAKAIVEQGTEFLITGNVGPRAMDVFRQFGIKAFSGSGIAKDALEKFFKGNLSEF